MTNLVQWTVEDDKEKMMSFDEMSNGQSLNDNFCPVDGNQITVGVHWTKWDNSACPLDDSGMVSTEQYGRPVCIETLTVWDHYNSSLIYVSKARIRL